MPERHCRTILTCNLLDNFRALATITMAKPHPLATADRVQSVSRALALLDALGATPHGQTAKGLAAATGLTVPTTYHLLITLVAGGYASRDPVSRLFTLGSRIPQLHQAFMARARPTVGTLPFLQALHQTTGETVHLARLFGDDAVTVELIGGREPLPVGIGYVGFSLPAHVTAVGRVLLAWSSPERQRAYLAGRYGHSAGPFPAADTAGLEAELSSIRKDGYAVDRGTSHPEVWCLAAPVVTTTGEINEALTILTSRSRFARDESALLAALLAVTHAAGNVVVSAPEGTSPARSPISPDAAEAAERALELPA